MYKVELLVSEIAVNELLEEMDEERTFELIDVKYDDYKFLVIYKVFLIPLTSGLLSLRGAFNTAACRNVSS